MIDIKDIITLSDNNKYSVISKVIKDNITYYYLVDINNISNIKFCYEDKSNNQLELVEVNNPDITRELISLFAKNINDML